MEKHIVFAREEELLQCKKFIMFFFFFFFFFFVVFFVFVFFQQKISAKYLAKPVQKSVQKCLTFFQQKYEYFDFMHARRLKELVTRDFFS